MSVLEKLVAGFLNKIIKPDGSGILSEALLKELLEDYLMAFADYVKQSEENYIVEKESYDNRKLPTNVIYHDFRPKTFN